MLKHKWTEPLKVHKLAKACIPNFSYYLPHEKSSEDCLFLNIYVPGKTLQLYINTSDSEQYKSVVTTNLS